MFCRPTSCRGVKEAPVDEGRGQKDPKVFWFFSSEKNISSSAAKQPISCPSTAQSRKIPLPVSYAEPASR
jgi:hypothetical protein